MKMKVQFTLCFALVEGWEKAEESQTSWNKRNSWNDENDVDLLNNNTNNIIFMQKKSIGKQKSTENYGQCILAAVIGHIHTHTIWILSSCRLLFVSVSWDLQLDPQFQVDFECHEFTIPLFVSVVDVVVDVVIVILFGIFFHYSVPKRHTHNEILLICKYLKIKKCHCFQRFICLIFPILTQLFAATAFSKIRIEPNVTGLGLGLSPSSAFICLTTKTMKICIAGNLKRSKRCTRL